MLGLYEMDDKVDELYRKYLQEAISPKLMNINKFLNHDVTFQRY